MRILSLSLLTLGLFTLTGCPVDGGGIGNQTPAITGTWRGELTCTRTQSVGTTAGQPTTETIQFEITFDNSGQPTELTILGFVDAPDQTASLVNVGDTASQTGATPNNLMVDQTVTVTSATYSDTSAVIGLSIDYGASGAVLTQDGGGTQTVRATVSGDSLEYTVEVSYEVTQTTGPINLNTGEDVTCTGTLTRS